MFNFLNGRAAAAKPGLSPKDAVERAAKGEIHVIDVRDPSEVAQTGKAKGALNIPLVALRFKADPKAPDFHPELTTDKPIAVYCASGARSNMAAKMLQQLGFDEVHNIGGLGHWQMAGGEVAR